MAYTTQDYIDAIKQDKDNIRINLNTKLGMDIPEGANFTDIADRTGTYVPSANLQNKQVEITENGVETIEADEGYDGLESVEITTNVSGGGGGTENLVANFSNITTATSKSTNFRILFEKISGELLAEIKNKVETGQITSFFAFFGWLEKVKELNLANLDLTKFEAKGLNSAFIGCAGLTKLNISNWKIPTKISDFSNLFSDCSSIETIDMSSWEMKGIITTTAYMFYNCKKLKTLKLPSTLNSNIVYSNYMFYNCQSLETLDLSNYDFSKVINMNYMFYGAKPNLILRNDFGLKCNNMSNMFQAFVGEEIDLTNLNTSACNTMDYMFGATTASLATSARIIFPENFASNCGSMQYMFYYYAGETLDVSKFNVSKVTSYRATFGYLSNVKVLDLSSWNIKTSGINVQNMFTNCRKLETLDLSNWDLTTLTANFSYMFGNVGLDSPTGLTTVYVKDEASQNWILTANNGRPTTWSTENVIIKGA